MKISIKDFLGIESLSLDLRAPINLIVGKNEAKKSSIRDAFFWCLTGKARGLKTQQQQAHLIRGGGKAAEVKVTRRDGREVFRRKTPKSPSSVSGPVPEDEVMTAIQCDPMTYLSLEEDLRRQILFRLLSGLHPKMQEIQTRLTNWLKDANIEEPFNNLIAELAKMAAGHGFKAAEDEAIIRRQIAKRVQKEPKVEEPQEKTTIGGREYVISDTAEQGVKNALEKVRKERDELLQKRGQVAGDSDKLPELEKELKALEAKHIVPPKPGEIERLQAEIEVKQPAVEELRKQVEALAPGQAPKFYPAVCPAFRDHEIACPKAAEMAVSGHEAPDPGKAAKLRADLKAEEDKLVPLERELKKAQAQKTAYDGHQQNLQDLTAKIAGLKDKAAETDELDKEIGTLDARLRNGNELLEAVRTFWRQKNEAKAAAEKLAKANKEVSLYDALAKALAPEGIPSRLIAQALKPMNDLLQVAAAHLFPGRTLILNKDLGIELSGAPYAILCKSEQFRVGVAFQYALGKMAGARLLMIDEADILDPQNRKGLVGFLLEIQPEFDFILVFATSDHADPSPVPEIQVWWLEDGRIKPVNQPMAA